MCERVNTTEETAGPLQAKQGHGRPHSAQHRHVALAVERIF